MKNRYVQVEAKTFSSWLIPVAASVFALAAALALAGMVCMLLPGSVSMMAADLIAGGITEASAVRTWKLIHIVLTVAAGVFPAILSVGLFLALRGHPGKGLILLCDIFEWVLKLLKWIARILLFILIYKLIRYMAAVLPKDEGMYLLYAMLVSEALMLIIVGTVYVLLCRFINALCDSAASIADTLENNRLSARSIPRFAATGFLLLSFLSAAFGLDRIFTMVVVQDYRSSHYAFITAQHPLLILSGAAMLLGALGSFLMAAYLYGFKRKSEKLYHMLSQD